MDATLVTNNAIVDLREKNREKASKANLVAKIGCRKSQWSCELEFSPSSHGKNRFWEKIDIPIMRLVNGTLIKFF